MRSCAPWRAPPGRPSCCARPATRESPATRRSWRATTSSRPPSRRGSTWWSSDRRRRSWTGSPTRCARPGWCASGRRRAPRGSRAPRRSPRRSWRRRASPPPPTASWGRSRSARLTRAVLASRRPDPVLDRERAARATRPQLGLRQWPEPLQQQLPQQVPAPLGQPQVQQGQSQQQASVVRSVFVIVASKAWGRWCEGFATGSADAGPVTAWTRRTVGARSRRRSTRR